MSLCRVWADALGAAWHSAGGSLELDILSDVLYILCLSPVIHTLGTKMMD